MLTIVDYGVGNLASMQNMLKRIHVPSVVSSNPEDIEMASKLLLPGVGAFDTCALKLQQSGLIELLKHRVLDQRIPLLGVCVGHQLLFEESEEGKLPGLGWLKGKVVRFDPHKMATGLKIPHMSWTEVTGCKTSALLSKLVEPRFYFVHSYHALPQDETDVLLYAEYGYRFVAAVECGNIAGVQFHPEKSHTFGMQLLSNFASNFG